MKRFPKYSTLGGIILVVLGLSQPVARVLDSTPLRRLVVLQISPLPGVFEKPEMGHSLVFTCRFRDGTIRESLVDYQFRGQSWATGHLLLFTYAELRRFYQPVRLSGYLKAQFCGRSRLLRDSVNCPQDIKSVSLEHVGPKLPRTPPITAECDP